MTELERLTEKEYLRNVMWRTPVKITIACLLDYLSITKGFHDDKQGIMYIISIILVFCAIYGILSSYFYYVDFSGGWIRGFITFFIILVIIAYLSSSEDKILVICSNIFLMTMIFGGVFLDLFRIIIYIILSIKKANE